MSSDYQTVLELVVGDIYDLNQNLVPDEVIDCGGNIGLFYLPLLPCIRVQGS